MYMLKDETFFESDRFLPRGLIAMSPPLDRSGQLQSKNKATSRSGKSG